MQHLRSHGKIGDCEQSKIYPNAIHFNPFQFRPTMSLLGFPVFYLSSSIVLSRYFDILVNSMTI